MQQPVFRILYPVFLITYLQCNQSKEYPINKDIYAGRDTLFSQMIYET